MYREIVIHNNMKQKDIKSGNQYLFWRTEHTHRKDMVGTTVTIVKSRIKGKGQCKNAYIGNIHGGHRIYITDTGRKVSACELKEIQPL